MSQKKKKKDYWRIFSSSVTIVVMIALPLYFMNILDIDFKIGNRVLVRKEEYEEFRTLKKLTELRTKIDDLYYTNYDPKLLEEGAIAGMFRALPDNYSRYYKKEELTEKNEKDKGEYIGIGMTLFQNVDKQFEVRSVEEGLPASIAGIRAGDIIISVDEVLLNEKNYNEVIANIKSDDKKYKFFGDYIDIHVRVDRAGEIFDFIVKKKKIVTSSVSGEIIEDIAYIKIDGFIQSTYEDFEKEIKKVNKAGIQSLVLDLRDNSGGLLTEAVKIAGSFVGKEVIYNTKSIHEENTSHKSTNNKIYNGKIIVLVNERTASASELLTAALKDYDRARVVGTTTFGKGIIQTTYTLYDGSGFKLTTKEYLTPKKAVIHNVGIEPDFVITDVDAQLSYAKEILTNDR